MGTTATSLHFLSTPMGYGARLPDDIEKAYRKLGYARPKKDGGDASKRVTLVPDESGDWLSVHDSENDRIDTGELKHLAVEITKKLGTVALLTSVQDSDSFEFIMFHNGRQVDAAVSDPDSHAGGLRMLKGKRRAQAWHSMFIARDLRRAVQAGRQGTLLAAWEERLKAPPGSTTAFAEDELAAWCALAGLSPERATLAPGDLTVDDEKAGCTTLLLERTAPRPATAALSQADMTLAYYRSDDDCPYHRFFPAAWPRYPGIPDSEQWLVVCSGGFTGLRLHLSLAGAPIRLDRVHLRALPFYNGQVTSMTALAEHEWIPPDPSGVSSSALVIDCPAFVVPPTNPQSRAQVILIVTVEATLPTEGIVTITPRLETAGGLQPSPALPPLRLRAVRPAWIPLVSRSGSSAPARIGNVLRLNTPSVWSCVAVLPSDGAEARGQAKSLAEAWLARLSPEAGIVAVVHTQKHMTSNFNISKATRTIPLADLTRDKSWGKLFDAETDYQTVFIGIARPDSPHAIAGLTVQVSLRGIGGVLGGATLSCAIWQIDHEQVEGQIGGSTDIGAAVFDQWIGTVTPQQAWIARAAWIPEFNTYNDFMRTVYEAAVVPGWDRSDGPHRMPALRFVADRLWLDESFFVALDPGSLGDVAEISRHGRTTALALRPGRSLDELEAALAPILPRVIGGQFPLG